MLADEVLLAEPAACQEPMRCFVTFFWVLAISLNPAIVLPGFVMAVAFCQTVLGVGSVSDPVVVLPGVVMAMARFNRPSIMVYGGSIKPGCSKIDGRNLAVSMTFESYGMLC